MREIGHSTSASIYNIRFLPSMRESYRRTVETLGRYDDTFLDYWGFLAPRLEQAHRVLRDDGTLYLHLDWREAHYAKVALNALFGRECFLNELIWAYDYGAKSRRRWPTKHDTILVSDAETTRATVESAIDRRARAIGARAWFPRDGRASERVDARTKGRARARVARDFEIFEAPRRNIHDNSSSLSSCDGRDRRRLDANRRISFASCESFACD